MPGLAGANSLCHNKSNTIRQLQQHPADILVQVPHINCVAVVWRVVVAVPLGYMRFFVLFFLFSRHSAASFVLGFLTFNMCLLFRGCPVELDMELSVSASHQKTRVLLAAEGATSCAAASCGSSSERRCAARISRLHSMSEAKKRVWANQSTREERFLAPHYCEFFNRGAWENNKKGKFPRLAKAFLYRVPESNRDFYLFFPVKCPPQRRHRE